MHNLNNSAAIYYSVVIVLSSILIFALISYLDWPVMAEVPLAACLFIQILAISKRFYSVWSKQKSFSLSETVNKVKAILLESQTVSKESRSQYNHHSSTS